MEYYPQDEANYRFDTIQKGMNAQGIDVLLIYSPQWKMECVHYVSNYRTLGLSSCALLSASKDPVLFISEIGDLRRATQTSWIKDIRVYDGKNMDSVAEAASTMGKTLGIVGLGIMSATQEASFKKLFGDNIKNGLDILDKAALIKTPWEIDLLRKGGKLADIGFRAEYAAIRPGLTEFELAAEMNYAMTSAGADDNFQMLAAGKDLSCMHVPRETCIVPGDLILTEITPMIGCITYAVQLCRTVKLGKASDVEKDKYNLLVEALESALSIIKPGVRAQEIALVQNQIIGAQGYEKYCNPPFMRSRGHNFGLGQFELTVDNEMELVPGMCMVVHPNQFIPETGYLACGETIIVTETGIERLSGLKGMLYEIEEVSV